MVRTADCGNDATALAARPQGFTEQAGICLLQGAHAGSGLEKGDLQGSAEGSSRAC